MTETLNSGVVRVLRPRPHACGQRRSRRSLAASGHRPPRDGRCVRVAGITAVSSSPAALAARIGREQQLRQPVLRTHGIRAD